MAWEPDYTTAADFKVFARITDTADDVAIARAITASSRAVDRFCSQHVFRQFGQTATAEARYYTPRWDADQLRWVIETDDFTSTEDLVIEIDTSNSDVYDETVTFYVPRPRDAIQNNRVYTQIAVSTSDSAQPTYFPDSARVTNIWGWDAFPVTVVEAVLLQTNRVHKRRTAPFQASGSPEKKTQVTTNLIDQLDKDIEVMLESYVKLGWTL